MCPQLICIIGFGWLEARHGLLHAVWRQPRSDVLHKNNKKLFSICPAPLPPGQDSFKQFPTPGTEGLDVSPGMPGGGMVTGKIEPCISMKERRGAPLLGSAKSIY